MPSRPAGPRTASGCPLTRARQHERQSDVLGIVNPAPVAELEHEAKLAGATETVLVAQGGQVTPLEENDLGPSRPGKYLMLRHAGRWAAVRLPGA